MPFLNGSGGAYLYDERRCSIQRPRVCSRGDPDDRADFRAALPFVVCARCSCLLWGTARRKARRGSPVERRNLRASDISARPPVSSLHQPGWSSVQEWRMPIRACGKRKCVSQASKTLLGNFSKMHRLAPWVSTGNSIALRPRNILSLARHECT